MIEILCGGSTGWKVVSNNDDYHRSRQRQTFDISVTWMRMSLTIYNKQEHLLYCLV